MNLPPQMRKPKKKGGNKEKRPHIGIWYSMVCPECHKPQATMPKGWHTCIYCHYVSKKVGWSD